MTIDDATAAEWDRIWKGRPKTIGEDIENSKEALDVEMWREEGKRAEAMGSTNPAHYYANGMECIEAIKGMLTEEEYRGYLRGTALKYLWRSPYKGNHKEDMKKAQWFIEKLRKLD